MVLVSHDRALLRTVCDSFLLVADARVAEFDGDLDDYLDWLAARREPRKAARKPVAREDDRQQKLALRRPLVKEVEAIERQLAGWQAEKRKLDDQLADPAFYASPDQVSLRALAQRQQELGRLIEQSEARWLVAHAELEALRDPR
jgi:ATP-binding cassette subfamily F protein 3